MSDYDIDSRFTFTIRLDTFRPSKAAADVLAWALGAGPYPSVLAPGYMPVSLAFRPCEWPASSPMSTATEAPIGQPAPAGPFADVTVARIATEESK